MRFAFHLSGCAAILLLAACASMQRPALPPVHGAVRVVAERHSASFDCTDPEVAWQAFVCRDPELAERDRTLSALWRQQLRAQDLAGRADLLASQRHWQLGLYPQCGLDALPAEDAALPPKPLACLKQAWQARIRVLQNLPPPVPTAGGAAAHPLAAYVAMRSAQSLEPALCSEMTQRFDGLIAQHGRLDPARVPGWRLLAGSHGPAQGRLPDGRRLDVQGHDAGPYGGYELRATALAVHGASVVDAGSVPAWLRDLPNSGGSFGGGASQTGDYAAIDVFQTADQRVFVLVNQTWGYYASAAKGESPHAALYELGAQGLQRRCLWRTYTTPPVAQALRGLPQFQGLQALLDSVAGPESLRLAPADRRDAGLLYKQAQWTLLHMPLLGIWEAERHRRWPLLRQRHDEALEALFIWSERNVPSKQLYRRLVPLIPAAHAELQQALQGSEGLKPDEARAAADLLLMAAIARAAEHLLDPAVPRPALAGERYPPRFAVAPQPGDLERGRAYPDLHSALLNRAAPAVIDDFMRYTWGSIERVGDPAKGRGPAGDTPLMAAVRSPQLLARLLAAGADVNGRNAWGKTALMMAAQADQLDSVQHLLQAGANLLGRTIAWQAEGAGGPDLAEGAAPGRTALMYAAANARAEVIQVLLARGADPKAADQQGQTACHRLDENMQLQPAERAGLRRPLCGRP